MPQRVVHVSTVLRSFESGTFDGDRRLIVAVDPLEIGAIVRKARLVAENDIKLVRVVFCEAQFDQKRGEVHL